MTGEMLEMPLGGIMISKPRNLKGKSRNITDGYDRALPFHVITQFDDFFDSLFGDIALRMINADNDIDLNADEENLHDASKENENHHENSHQDHIKVTDVRDITEEERNKNKIKEITANKEKEIKTEKKSEETIITVDEKKNNDGINIDPEDHEDQAIAVKFDTEAENKSSDNIMTAKERKKQIKEQRKKNLFAKICKYVFYCLVLLSFYIVIKRLLQILGLIEPYDTKKSYDNLDNNTNDKKTVELKSSTTNAKSE